MDSSKASVTRHQAACSVPQKTLHIENFKSPKIDANEAAVILNCDDKQGKKTSLFKWHTNNFANKVRSDFTRTSAQSFTRHT